MIQRTMLRGCLALALFAASACASSTGPDGVIATGTWGGEHASLTIDAGGGAIEFDCAHGTLPAPLTLNDGAFDIAGDYVQEHGGPIRLDETLVRQPARYRGTIEDKRMTLRVTLTDTGQDIGSFALTLGATGRVFKCL